MRRRFSVAVIASVLLGAAVLAQGQDLRTRAMPHYRFGLENLRSERWEEAIRYFQQALDVDPSFEMAHYALGRAYMGQKQFAPAAAAFSRARDLYQGQAGRQFANAHEAQRYRQDRMTEIDQTIREYQVMPQTFQVQEMIRQLNERKRQLQDVISRGTNITIATSVPAYVSLSLGSAYFRLGKLADAEREYKAALTADPKAGEAHSNLAVVYMETGRFDDAEQAIRNAEKVGFRVVPQLKEELQRRKRGN